MIRLLQLRSRLARTTLMGAWLALAMSAPGFPATSVPSQAYGVSLSIVAGDKQTGRPNDAGWVTVTLSNVSNQDLAVVYTPATIRLRFDVEDASGRHIGRRMYPSTVDSVRTSSYFPIGRTAMYVARVVDWSNIRQPGTYCVRAIYRIAIMGSIPREIELVSNQIAVSIPSLR